MQANIVTHSFSHSDWFMTSAAPTKILPQDFQNGVWKRGTPSSSVRTQFSILQLEGMRLIPRVKRDERQSPRGIETLFPKILEQYYPTKPKCEPHM